MGLRDFGGRGFLFGGFADAFAGLPRDRIQSGANVVTTDYSDWATNCPEYKVTAVEVRLTNHESSWQERYEQLKRLQRIETVAAE